MTYDTWTAIWYWALIGALPAALVIAAIIIARTGGSDGARRWFLVIGVLGAVVVAVFGPWIANTLNPPPFDPAFAGGRGLDLRGLGNVLGAWIGGALSLAVTLAAAALLAFQASRRRRRGAHDNAERARSRQDQPDSGSDVSRTGTLGG